MREAPNSLNTGSHDAADPEPSQGKEERECFPRPDIGRAKLVRQNSKAINLHRAGGSSLAFEKIANARWSELMR